MKDLITQHAATVATSPKAAAIVASATAGSGVASLLDLINSGLGLVAVTAGIVLTSILIRKHAFEFKQMKLQAAEQDGRRTEDKKLPPE